MVKDHGFKDLRSNKFNANTFKTKLEDYGYDPLTVGDFKQVKLHVLYVQKHQVECGLKAPFQASSSALFPVNSFELTCSRCWQDKTWPNRC